MDKTQNLFDAFPGNSARDWRVKAEQDLRGKPLDDLRWHLGPDIELDPFYHPDDMEMAWPPLDRPGGRSWEIGELIDVREPRQANTELLEGLANGVEAPLFILRRSFNEEELKSLLQDVQPSLISLHFTQPFPDRDPPALLHRLHLLLGEEAEQIPGSIDYDPMLDWADPPYDELAAAIRFAEENLSRFRVLQINGLRFHSGPENATQELALILAKGNEYLAQLQTRDLLPATASRYLQFSLALSTSYFVEIAKLRALRLLWANVLDAYGAVAEPPVLVAHLAEESQDDDQYTNMIKAGTQAMAAVIGGADRLYVRPADFTPYQPGTPFTRRVARNVQHLLRLESYLDRVVDPGAGSYYIEQLTEQLAEQAWTIFQQIDSEREFA